MSLIYGNEHDVQASVRRRRRRIAGTRRIRTNRRVRSLMIIISVSMIAAIGGYTGIQNGFSDTGISNKAYAAEIDIYERVVVKSGDTIWDIAGNYTEPSKDVRKQVRAICEINNVEPGKIYPGQVLLVPLKFQ